LKSSIFIIANKIVSQIKKYFYTFLSSGFQSLSSIGINKILAVYGGPIAVLYYSQFQSFFGMIGTVGAGSMGKGIMTIAAERFDIDKVGFYSAIKSAIEIIFYFSGAVSILVIVFSNLISDFLFGTSSEVWLIFAIALNLIFFSFNSMYISLINGSGNFKIFNQLRLVQSIGTLIMVLIGVVYAGWRGAIYSTVLIQLLIFFYVSIYILRGLNVNLFTVFKSKSNIADRRLLLSYTSVTIISTIVISICQIYMRNITVSLLSVTTAGYFEALLKLTTSVTSLFWGVFSIHYLPLIAKCKTFEDLKGTIRSFMTKMLLSVLLMGLVFILFSSHVIVLFYNSDFLIIEKLIIPQILSEMIRVIAWSLGSVLITRKYVLIFGMLDVFFSMTLIIFLSYFLNSFGILGRIYLQSISSGVYALVCFFIIWNRIRKDISKPLLSD
jgi:O-antigen/teichoic acid export membrane protein